MKLSQLFSPGEVPTLKSHVLPVGRADRTGINSSSAVKKLAARGALLALPGTVATGCASGLSPADGPPPWVGLIFLAPFLLMGIIFLLAITTAIGTQMRKVSNSKDSSPPTIEADTDPLRRINPGAYDSQPNGSPTPEQSNSGDDRSHNTGGEAVSPQSSDSWSSGSSSDGGSWSSDSSSSSSDSSSSSGGGGGD